MAGTAQEDHATYLHMSCGVAPFLCVFFLWDAADPLCRHYLLLVWALLARLPSLVEYFWAYGVDQLATALLVARLALSLGQLSRGPLVRAYSGCVGPVLLTDRLLVRPCAVFRLTSGPSTWPISRTLVRTSLGVAVVQPRG